MRLLVLLMAMIVLSWEAEAQNPKATGLIFLDQGQYQSIPPAPPPLAGPPPATVDLSAYGYFPEPGDQGKQSSCVGWAVAYGLKSYQKNREFRLQNVAANFRFSPAFIYNQVKKTNCHGGSSIRDAMDIIESQGALPLETFGYDETVCDRQPTDPQIQSAWEYRIAKWMRVNVQSLAEMKAQLVRGFPVVVAMKVHQAFSDWPGGGVYKAAGASAGAYVGGHALVVVGYADQLKAFKVLNSWGTKWGDGGYAWIDYATFQSLTLEGYVTIDIFLDRVAMAAGSVPQGAWPQTSPVPTTPSGPVVSSPGPTRSAQPAAKGQEPASEQPSSGKRSVIAGAPAPSAPPSSGPDQPRSAERAAQPPTRGSTPVKPGTAPPTLTPAVLTASVRSTTEPKILFNWRGYNVQPYSVWLELPDTLVSSIDRVEYWFNHPTFSNPKRSVSGSSIFLATWKGYGCINDAKVIVHLKDRSKIEAPFDLCAAQHRF